MTSANINFFISFKGIASAMHRLCLPTVSQYLTTEVCAASKVGRDIKQNDMVTSAGRENHVPSPSGHSRKCTGVINISVRYCQTPAAFWLRAVA